MDVMDHVIAPPSLESALTTESASQAGIKKLILIGSSIGGWILLLLAMKQWRHSCQLHAVVLVNPAIDLSETFWLSLSHEEQAIVKSSGVQSLKSPYLSPGYDLVGLAFFEQGRRNLLLVSHKGTNPQNPLNTSLAQRHCAASPLPYTTDCHLAAPLKGMTCPLQILHGDEDQVVLLSTSMNLLELWGSRRPSCNRCPSSTVRESAISLTPEVGHFTHTNTYYDLIKMSCDESATHHPGSIYTAVREADNARYCINREGVTF
ncbi:hypothetical protein CEUSTIGMA_g6273.t1 [Chlamydomonas eustigma]|uniref:Serine aminopeptidase S33 domain-containing protein n=1 Tax=Chlamydomonas eustigma TaxID=1157962 RepID=A0A250X712_9CHLO|nr:hypothetical protein CEUSTIGMA_g6273.t1 [Chlamydomonas eustigma]|eukprot:GAX78836.1 hypothetical protein CEUSTIGMA_g6273.t1 [Chlamydomonas eustigma]